MKGVGEPGAGEPHARFDGGELEKEPAMAADYGSPRETERLSPASPTAGNLASSLPDHPRAYISDRGHFVKWCGTYGLCRLPADRRCPVRPHRRSIGDGRHAQIVDQTNLQTGGPSAPMSLSVPSQSHRASLGV